MTMDNCHPSRPQSRILQARAQCSVWLKAWGRLRHPALCACCARHWCPQSTALAFSFLILSSLFLNHHCLELLYLGLTWHHRGRGDRNPPMTQMACLAWSPLHECRCSLREDWPWRKWSCSQSGSSVASFAQQTFRGGRSASPWHLQDTCPHSEKLVLLETICRPHLKPGEKPKFSLPRYLHYL